MVIKCLFCLFLGQRGYCCHHWWQPLNKQQCCIITISKKKNMCGGGLGKSLPPRIKNGIALMSSPGLVLVHRITDREQINTLLITGVATMKSHCNLTRVMRKQTLRSLLLLHAKKNWGTGAPPILLWLWHRLQNIIYEDSRVIFCRRCHTQRRIDGVWQRQRP